MSEAAFKLDGKIALVTGAGRGMGRSIAEVLARHGAAVAIQDIDLDVAETAADEICKAGGKAIALGGDITAIETAEGLVAATRAQLGDIDILVNNAAVQEHMHWMEAKVERLEWQWRGNVLAPWVLMRLCAPAMKAKKWGRVLNMSSIQAKGGAPGMLGYSVTKGALNLMTTAASRDLAGEGITVNALSPGIFDTFRNREGFSDPQRKADTAKWVPLGRLGMPSDVEGISLLLCSDAGGYITGQVIYVDGGMSAR